MFFVPVCSSSIKLLIEYTFKSSVGLTASSFGLGATLSNYLGQKVVEQFGHVTSLMGSFVISFIPIILFALFMPETMGKRGGVTKSVSLHV